MLVLTLLSCAARPATPNPAIASGTVQLDPDGLLSPGELIQLMESSTRWYQIEEAPLGEAWTDLRDPGRDPPLTDPDNILEPGPAGLRLTAQTPPGEVSGALDQAHQAFTDGDYDEATQLYGRAVRDAPDFAKPYIWLGNSYYSLGDWDRAERWLVEGLTRNPIDYQGHWFLGDAYNRQGRGSEALQQHLQAWYYNPNHEDLTEALWHSAQANGRRLRTQRLNFPYEVDTGRKRTTIRISDPIWLPLAVCEALWEAEPELQALTPQNDPYGLTMYRACLVAEVAALEAFESQGTLPERAQLLLDAVRDGYLEAVIWWEIAGTREPDLIPLYPEALREEILEYLDRYVLVEELEAPRAPTR